MLKFNLYLSLCNITSLVNVAYFVLKNKIRTSNSRLLTLFNLASVSFLICDEKTGRKMPGTRENDVCYRMKNVEIRVEKSFLALC